MPVLHAKPAPPQTPSQPELRRILRLDVPVIVKLAERKQTLKVQDGAIPNVFVDKDKMHEVLLNLIGNAIKYTPEEGKISVSFKKENGMVETRTQRLL